MTRSTFRRADRLPESAFAPAVRSTSPARTAHLRVHARPNGLGRSRLGVSVGRKFGRAVLRNRLKRLAREAFRRSEEVRGAGLDIVVVAQDVRVLDHADEIAQALALAVAGLRRAQDGDTESAEGVAAKKKKKKAKPR